MKVISLLSRFYHNLTTATEPDAIPVSETKRKEAPTTTTSETTPVLTKRIKLEGSGSRGRIRTADFDDLTRSIIGVYLHISRSDWRCRALS